MRDKHPDHTHTNVHAFVNTIAEEVRRGYGIIPLTGAGVSVSAGIPSGPVLSAYVLSLIHSIESVDKDKDPFRNPGFNCADEPWPPVDGHHLADRGVSWSNDYMLHLTRMAGMMRLPTQQVFDSFFTFLMRDKDPSRAHRLIAHLTMHLGSRLVLTTNFDRLQERAFEEAGSHPQVFEIPSGGALPTFSSVSEQPAVIKLHGGTTSLVAGNDVHDPPTVSDIESFKSYFTNGGKRAKNHLLVIGFAGYDTRILRMIQSLVTLPGGIKIFWLAYNKADSENAERISYAIYNREDLCLATTPQWFYHCQHYDAGLFLLHLYQAISFSIPPADLLLPSVAQLPLAPYPAFGILNQEAPHIELKFSNKVSQFKAVVENGGQYEITSIDDSFGVVSAASCLFHELYYKRNVCLWFDVDEDCDEYEIFYSLYDAIASRIAATPRFNAATDGGNLESVKQDLCRMLLEPPIPTFAFILNFRGVLKNYYPDAATREWCDTIKGLGPAPSGKVNRVVRNLVAFFSKLHSDKNNVVIVLTRQKTTPSPLVIDDNFSPYGKWEVPRDEPKATFCYALALLRGSVHYAALISRAFFWNPELKDRDRARHAREFIGELTETNRLRVKRGGFVVAQAELKKQILQYWEPEGNVVDPEKAVRLRRSLADWYEKVFFSSGDCFAALESMRFRLDVILLLKRVQDQDQMVAAYPIAALTQILSLLRDSYPALINHAHRYAIYKQVCQLSEKARHLKRWHKRTEVLESELRALAQALDRRCGGKSPAKAWWSRMLGRPRVSPRFRGGIEAAWGGFESSEPLRHKGYLSACESLRGHEFEEAKKELVRTLAAIDVAPKDFPFKLVGSLDGGHWLPPVDAGFVRFEQASLRLVVKCFRRHAQVTIGQLEVQQAMKWLDEGCAGRPNDVGWAGREDLFKIQRHVYNVCRELRRYVVTRANSGFLLRESSRLRLLQAQILSMDGRKYEARRRLSESVATLRYAGRYYDGGWWAEHELAKCTVMLNLAEYELDILRAGAHLPGAPSLEGERICACNSLERYITNAVDAYLRGAKLVRSGRNSNAWENRVIELQFRIALIVKNFRWIVKCLKIEDTYTCSARVSRVIDLTNNPAPLESRCFRQMALTEGDPYRRARLIVLMKGLAAPLHFPVNTSGKALSLQQVSPYDSLSKILPRPLKFAGRDPLVTRFINRVRHESRSG